MCCPCNSEFIDILCVHITFQISRHVFIFIYIVTYSRVYFQQLCSPISQNSRIHEVKLLSYSQNYRNYHTKLLKGSPDHLATKPFLYKSCTFQSANEKGSNPVRYLYTKHPTGNLLILPVFKNPIYGFEIFLNEQSAL